MKLVNVRQKIFLVYQVLLVIISLLLVVQSCRQKSDPGVVPESSAQIGGLTVSASKEVTSKEISAGGGELIVSDPASPLNGLKIDVPAGAYSDNRTFAVSYSYVNKHDFGSDFKPLTPLIEVKNGGGYAQQPMSISLPIQLPTNHKACVFVFNDSGDFSVLPTRNLFPNKIVVDASHFSQDLVTKGGRVAAKTGVKTWVKLLVVGSDRAVLDAVEYDTGFTPGVDDWAFPNYGSYAYPDGICTGMALTELWYFNFMKAKSGNGPLRENKLVSNPFFEASNNLIKDKNWMLNDTGIKFASMVSVIQHSVISRWSKLINSFTTDHEDIYYDVAFYYKFNKNPKPDFMQISLKNGKGNHAVLITGKTKKGLLIADPNKTEISDLIFSSKGFFEDYSSAENLKKGTKLYNRFIRLPDIDYSYIANKWKEVESKTIGTDCFPDYSYNLRLGDQQVKLQDGLHIFNNFEIDSYKNTDTSLYVINRNSELTKLIKNADGTYYPPAGTTKIGIVHLAANPSQDCAGNIPNDKEPQWAGAKWFDINVEQNTETYFSCKVNGVDYSFATANMGHPIANPPTDAVYITGYNGKNLVSITFNPASLLKGKGNYLFHYFMPFAPQQDTNIAFNLTQPDKPALASSSTKYAVWNDMLANGPTSGGLTITEFSDYIEGTFEFENNGDSKFVTPNIKVTEGRFRCKVLK